MGYVMSDWGAARQQGDCSMNRHFILATLVAGTAATLVLASTTALAAKPGGGGSTDPCIGAAARGFPSFGFNRQVTSKGLVTWEYRVADVTGACDQRVWSRSWSTRYPDVFIRYDAENGSGIGVGSTSSFGLVGSRFTVSFDGSGKPTISAAPFASILTLSQIAARPLPMELVLAGWQIGSMGSARISPSGTWILISSHDLNGTAAVYWRCELGTPIDANTCGVVYYARAAEDSYANWGGTDKTLHIVQSASNGSGSSLYVVDISNGTAPVEVFGRGTYLTASRATIVSGPGGSQSERVVLHEAGPTVCEALNIVFDLDSCADNSCLIMNGAGHRGAAAMDWLPDGRVVQNGIAQKGSNCSGSGTINAFDPVLDMNGKLTTLTSGQDPDGAGGG
jgi:hypothetical protein